MQGKMNTQQSLVKKSFKEISDKVNTAYDNFVLENIN